LYGAWGAGSHGFIQLSHVAAKLDCGTKDLSPVRYL
jgi:hypothetical protein